MTLNITLGTFEKELSVLDIDIHKSITRYINLGKNYNVRFGITHLQNNLFNLKIYDKSFRLKYDINFIKLNIILNAIKEFIRKESNFENSDIEKIATFILNDKDNEAKNV